jgi:hypothetical protein
MRSISSLQTLNERSSGRKTNWKARNRRPYINQDRSILMKRALLSVTVINQNVYAQRTPIRDYFTVDGSQRGLTNLRRTKPKPVGESKRCSEWRRSQVVTFVICYHCYWKEPKAACGLCQRQMRFTADNGGICLECKLWGWGPQEITCRRCGKSRPPAARRSELCRSCHERRCRGKCSRCDRDCSYELKTAKLCKRCAHNHQAAKRLRIFIEKISISNELNRSVFQKLVETIDWDRVDEEFRRHIFEFGTFLQSHTLEPLTWSSIRKVCYELKAHKFRRVRECLEDVGDLLLGPASAKSDEINIDPLRPVAWMPRDVRQMMEAFERWLCEDRNNTPFTRQGHFGTLSRFWKCCAKRGVSLMADVKASHVEEFLYTLSVQWKCLRCSYTKKVSSRGENPPGACENSTCRAVASFENGRSGFHSRSIHIVLTTCFGDCESSRHNELYLCHESRTFLLSGNDKFFC